MFSDLEAHVEVHVAAKKHAAPLSAGLRHLASFPPRSCLSNYHSLAALRRCRRARAKCFEVSSLFSPFFQKNTRFFLPLIPRDCEGDHSALRKAMDAMKEEEEKAAKAVEEEEAAAEEKKEDKGKAVEKAAEDDGREGGRSRGRSRSRSRSRSGKKKSGGKSGDSDSESRSAPRASTISGRRSGAAAAAAAAATPTRGGRRSSSPPRWRMRKRRAWGWFPGGRTIRPRPAPTAPPPRPASAATRRSGASSITKAGLRTRCIPVAP
jgi:hypothetical protein